MTSLRAHKGARCECGVDSRHPARSDGRARASLAARRSAPPGTIRIGTSTATKMFRIQLTKINQSESHPATPAGRGTHHAPSLVQLWRSAAPTTRLDTHGMGGGRTWEGGRRNTMASTVTTTATLPPQPDPANTTMAAAEEQIRERRVWGEAQRTRRAPRDLDRPDRHAPAPFCARRARVLSLLMALDMALASTRARGTW